MHTPKNVPPGDDSNELVRLVSSAQESGQSDQYAGKRTSLRFKAGMQLDVTSDPDDPSAIHSALMHNVSTGGIAFWSRHQWRRGERVNVRQYCSDHSARWLAARICHCTTGIRGYLIGARFESPLPLKGGDAEAGSRADGSAGDGQEEPPKPQRPASLPQRRRLLARVIRRHGA